MNRILAAVDGSALSLKAVSVAADLTRQYGAELILLTVEEEQPAAQPSRFWSQRQPAGNPAGDEVRDRTSQDAKGALSSARMAARAVGVVKISTRSSVGEPASQIVAVARSQEADLIVIANGRRGRGNGMLSGVAQKVTAHAHCPVLVVR
jgi:nucleotide-binding universal stress UspA family protein